LSEGLTNALIDAGSLESLRRFPRMPNYEIQIFESLQALSRRAASRFAELAKSASSARPFSCALSGGSTPRRLYELLAEPEFQIAWDNVHLFQVDERCVPPDNPESNYRMIRESLLQKIAIPNGNFHRMAAEIPDREQATRQYEKDLARVLSPANDAPPRLELIFLGMGDDGHTASLFPGSTALGEEKRWVCPNYSPRLGKFRLTMTYPVLNAAAEVIFLVSGEDKAETLRAVLEGPAGELPAQGVRPVGGRLRWFVDRSAARLLSQAVRRGA
jgi:6-phosphogluconolactonase